MLASVSAWASDQKRKAEMAKAAIASKRPKPACPPEECEVCADAMPVSPLFVPAAPLRGEKAGQPASLSAVTLERDQGCDGAGMGR